MTLEDNSSLLKLKGQSTVHAVLFSTRGQLCCVMLFSYICRGHMTILQCQLKQNSLFTHRFSQKVDVCASFCSMAKDACEDSLWHQFIRTNETWMALRT